VPFFELQAQFQGKKRTLLSLAIIGYKRQLEFFQLVLYVVKHFEAIF
jgi:hypothetical protein